MGEQNLTQRERPTVALVIQRLDKQDEILSEIRSQAKLTNGRVTALEREQIKRTTREAVLAEVATAATVRHEWSVSTIIAVIGVVAAVSATIAQLF